MKYGYESSTILVDLNSISLFSIGFSTAYLTLGFMPHVMHV